MKEYIVGTEMINGREILTMDGLSTLYILADTGVINAPSKGFLPELSDAEMRVLFRRMVDRRPKA